MGFATMMFIQIGDLLYLTFILLELAELSSLTVQIAVSGTFYRRCIGPAILDFDLHNAMVSSYPE